VAGEVLVNFRNMLCTVPRQGVEHAAMLIASTLASAAMGARLESSQIIRTLAQERGGSPEASVWFASASKLPVSDAAQVAMAGRIWVENEVDFCNPRNLITVAVALTAGAGDLTLKFGAFTVGGIGTATFGAIILYQILAWSSAKQ
jgi:hypothetical protein